MFTENYFNEDLLNEDLLSEDLLSEDLVYENIDDARKNRLGKRIGAAIRPRVAQVSNFANRLSGRGSEYITKSELKQSFDSISNDVNELKKSTIETNKSLKALDAKHTELAKIDARKNDSQTQVLRNMQMTGLISSLLNQPKFNVSNLHYKGEPISETNAGKTVTTDTTLSLLLPMMATQGGAGGGDMSTMLPLILLMNNNSTGGGTDNTMLLVMMMMMNQGKK
jgi:hypothetical protein